MDEQLLITDKALSLQITMNEMFVNIYFDPQALFRYTQC